MSAKTKKPTATKRKAPTKIVKKARRAKVPVISKSLVTIPPPAPKIQL
jgi:hypothetical protein